MTAFAEVSTPKCALPQFRDQCLAIVSSTGRLPDLLTDMVQRFPGGFLLIALTMFAVATPAAAAPGSQARLRHPAADAYNVRVGTQTFGVKYHFTTNTPLIETASAIRELDSDILKFYLGPGLARQYGIRIPKHITNLTSLAKLEPSCREVLDMPFQHIFAWTYPFSPSGEVVWQDGYSRQERRREYEEIFSLSRYLLTNYNNSGKRFYLGHWEGDWYLLPNYNTTVNPSPTRMQGMIDWLNSRQAAVDDALLSTPHTNVFVYHYTEVNRVRDAMANSPSNNQRLVNAVLPSITNLDYVSWSSYDGMDLPEPDLHATLSFIERNLSTNKASTIPGKRVFIGEYGWGGTLSSADQEAPTRNYIQQLLKWGTPFILFWEMYNNEPHKQYWLVDTNNVKVPCWHLHQRFINAARFKVAQFHETMGRVPSSDEFASMAIRLLERPLPAPVRVSVRNENASGISKTSASLHGSVQQGIYGDELAMVQLYYGTDDGGTASAQWASSVACGVNTNFNGGSFTARLNNLVAGTRYHFRFAASTSDGLFWAPSTDSFVTLAESD